jgi:hypothetical protein
MEKPKKKNSNSVQHCSGLEHLPPKSLICLAQEKGVCKRAARTTTKLLQPHDSAVILNFSWCFQSENIQRTITLSI